ncbi:tyrosine-type recombinase/integrase [Clostridium beijerinckii]|jgi:Site-specific recombinase XerD|uniref:Site-specific integrase n=2 Tax=Clostridium beijerinckii TaxID=1520 RepID=A0AAE2UUX5_CLOBE|nr:site-specific integrase [Clostridium beijerinckii]ABR37107.1 phage integrase family protein [Clostridium beijerinckii NCIMB 8052]AIU03079.1 phage integrase family protein [Clostridium beijerinckii ATCC 35702]MBC2458144.1 site-specific integrase [Clostridium beijerinckii]MBC2475371.1 site-specific integrase [Clostridium beijerinckii]MBF7808239.1 site-specific integrase [Clostridium beijerinckii]
MARIKLRAFREVKNYTRTVSDCYMEYMNYCKYRGQREGTIKSKEGFYKYVLPKMISVDEDITKITESMVLIHVNSMIDRGLKGGTYSTFVVKLKAFLTYCFKRKYLQEFEVKIPNVVLEKKAVYTEDEINILLTKPNLNTCVIGDYRSYVMIAFFVGTGCRSETILNVRVKDINFEKDSILFSHMKTKRQATVPMSKFLRGELLEYINNMNLKHNDLLFPKIDGTQMSYDTMHQNFKNYFKHCNIKMHGVNTFRNTFATMFIKNGGDIYRLKLLLNHSTIKTTERYINLLPLDFKEDLLKYNPLDNLQNNIIKGTKLKFKNRK